VRPIPADNLHIFTGILRAELRRKGATLPLVRRGDWTSVPLSSHPCGGLEMAPHENKWSLPDGAHE